MTIGGNFGRPFAPLSGEKLRLHSFTDPKKQSGTKQQQTVDPSERLDRLGQSGAAAVRRFAAQELRENTDIRNSGAAAGGVYRTKEVRRGKGSLVHHTTKPVKRTKGHIAAPSNQHAAVLTSGASLDAPRSQSAGVTLSYEGGSKRADPRQKLPPVSGIAPIHEGRPLSIHVGAGGLASRYIQTAPAVSRSVSLPPIDQQFASSGGIGGIGGVQFASQTPNTRQPKQHRFGRQPVPAAALLQQSFAHAMQNYTSTEEGQSGL
jgi:hypothetical protein